MKIFLEIFSAMRQNGATFILIITNIKCRKKGIHQIFSFIGTIFFYFLSHILL